MARASSVSAPHWLELRVSIPSEPHIQHWRSVLACKDAELAQTTWDSYVSQRAAVKQLIDNTPKSELKGLARVELRVHLSLQTIHFYNITSDGVGKERGENKQRRNL